LRPSSAARRSYSIRECRPADLDPILEIERRSFPDAYDRAIFVQLLAAEPGGFLVAEKEDLVLGYISAVSDGEDAMIYSIAVSDSARRTGAGSALMEAELKYLSMRAKHVYLQVSVKNVAAISLYTTFSFVEIGRVKRYYANGDDAITMKLEL
jgi:ribosomal-protein-alanine N-acetyltransferase